MSLLTNSFGNVSVKLKHHSKQKVHCPKCKRKTMGDLFIDETTTVTAIDGKDAHPFLWFCEANRKHQRKPGWTRPVDFTELAMTGADSFLQGLPQLDASDETWQEWAYVKASGMDESALAQIVKTLDAVRNMKNLD